MNREDIMTLVERYALAMRLVDRHGNQYGDRDLLTLTHQQIREGLKVLVVSEREACAKVCDQMFHDWCNQEFEDEDEAYRNKPDAEDCKKAIRERGNT